MTYIMKPYDTALEEILKNGVKKENRTGVDTLAIFGMQRRYRIDEYFPLLTKRKLWPKAIFAELLWFISGSTNTKTLEELGSKIWNPWRSEEFEKNNHFAEGALGPVYGFQLRHFNGNYNKGIEYKGNERGYGFRGFDQLAMVIDKLKNDPSSRRILFDLWNPNQMSQMRLAPCHYSFQLDVCDGKLSGMLTQRSADYPIGVPANIQFYSALIYMLAQQTGYEPYEFIHTTGDSHIYVDQIEGVEEYLSKDEVDSPKLKLKNAPDIDSYTLDHFQVVGYKPQKSIKMPVAV